MAELSVMSVEDDGLEAAERGEGSTGETRAATPLGISEAATLAFAGISFRVLTSKGEKHDILRGISGYCKGGRLLALMGASGKEDIPSEGAEVSKGQSKAEQMHQHQLRNCLQSTRRTSKFPVQLLDLLANQVRGAFAVTERLRLSSLNKKDFGLLRAHGIKITCIRCNEILGGLLIVKGLYVLLYSLLMPAGAGKTSLVGPTDCHTISVVACCTCWSIYEEVNLRNLVLIIMSKFCR